MMNIIEKIVSIIYLIGWVIAPLLVNDVLHSRDINLPSDLATYGVLIWYAIPFVYWLVFIRSKEPSKTFDSKEPSYKDKGQNDWLNRD